MRGPDLTRLASLVGLLVFLRAPVIAGGIDWPVIVEKNADEGEGSKVAVLRPLENGFANSNCFRASVHIVYDNRPIRERLLERLPMTHEDHGAAVNLLVAAQSTGAPIKFGSMGDGLGSRPGKPCEFLSNGLQIFEDKSFGRAVYSYFKWP